MTIPAAVLEAAMVRAATPPRPLVDTPLLRIAYLTGRHGLRVSGEIDLANRHHLARVLRRESAAGTGDLWLDMSALRFIDVGGVLICADTARALDRDSRRLIAVRPPRSALRVLSVIGAEDTPGLTVIDAVT